MNRLEIAVALAPMFKHKFDYSDIKEDSRRIAELAFAQADALIEFAEKNPGKEPIQALPPISWATSGYCQPVYDPKEQMTEPAKVTFTSGGAK